MASGITRGLNMIIMTFIFGCQREIKEAFILPDKRSFQNLKEYVLIGCPYIIMTFVDYLCYEMMCIVCGLLGVT